MTVFVNIRLFPNHGTRSAAVTWDMTAEAPPGDVYVAFSPTGTAGSWQPLHTDPIPSDVGFYMDDRLVMKSGMGEGFYRLLLVTGEGEYRSEAVQLLGDVTPREFGVVRAIVHREFTMMRVSDGFPVWHCIPRSHGVPANTKDPDTGMSSGRECGETDPEIDSYGLPFQGGFYPPVLTWVKVLETQETVQDGAEGLPPTETVALRLRMLAFPRPRRGHMLVDPTNDRRYLIGGDIRMPYRLRGVIPVAYDAGAEFLNTSDDRYRFPTPEIDTKAYRRIPYWSPSWSPAMELEDDDD